MKVRSIHPLLVLAALVGALCLPYPASSLLAASPAANKRELVYGRAFSPAPIAADRNAQRAYDIMPQGRDSNCDFIALRNGIQNIGGDGDGAYWQARRLVSQQPRDYKEGFYTLRGENGSDQPFSLDNLGAAPEAFIGVYQAVGYDASLIASAPDTVDLPFARAIVDQLQARPYASFAHAWITPRAYNAAARWITVPETGERVGLLYPYHEVALIAEPGRSDEVIVLDGLVGYAYAISLDRLAYLLRGFNAVLLVSVSDRDLAGHQRAMHDQQGQPYVSARLGGPFLRQARAIFGPDYLAWGDVVGQPFRSRDGAAEKVILPETFVHYERVGAGEVTLALLGVQMGRDLEAASLLPAGTIRPWEDKTLVNGIRQWTIDTFGSIERFEGIFGKPLTDEFWLSSDQMRQAVLRGVPFPAADQDATEGFVCVLTERAMIAWHPTNGAFLVPLGAIYLAESGGGA